MNSFIKCLYREMIKIIFISDDLNVMNLILISVQKNF